MRQHLHTAFIPPIIALAASALLFSAAPLPVHATGAPFEFRQVKPDLQIEIPTLRFSDVRVRTIDGEPTDVSIPWIGEYIAAIYRWAVPVGAILATVVIMAAGVIWLTSGGAGTLSTAKEWITNAVIGLLLLVGSYVILNIVNPDLVRLQALQVQIVRPVFIEAQESDDSFDHGATCPGGESFRPVPRTAPNLGLIEGKDLLLPEVGSKLIEAAREAERRNYGLYVCSAARTLQKQQALWDEAIRNYGSDEAASRYVARPRCGSPHLTGRTVDIVLMSKDLRTPITGNGCTKSNVSGANARQTTEEQRILEEIMYTVGWRRYCGEWWHFEYGTPRAQRAGANKCA